MRNSTVKDWACCLLAASLSVAYGCAEPKTTPQSPTMDPVERQHDETDLPPPPPDTEAPPPATPPMEPHEEPPPDPFGGQQTGPVSQTEVEHFAEIQIALAPLQQQLAKEVQKGASQAQLEQLHAQLHQKAGQIVEASSLSLKRFDEIAVLARRDPDLGRRVQAAIERNMGGN